MEANYKNMGKWELEKAVFLQNVAVGLGMDLSGYGTVDVNPNSGYTYLWLEDYPFCLFMPISCELVVDYVSAMWSNPEDGEEHEFNLDKNTTLSDLEAWVKELELGNREEQSLI